MKSISASDNAPLAILLDDRGVQSVVVLASGPGTEMTRSIVQSVASHVDRGEQVLAVNLIFTGDASPDKPRRPTEPVKLPALYTEVYASPDQWPGIERWLRDRPPSALYAMLLASIRERPIGMEAAQLLAIAKWAHESYKPHRQMMLEATGIRSQVIALLGSALEPQTFSELAVRDGMESFGYLLDKAIRYQEAPDLFCLDLYKEFDIDSLAVLAEPTRVVWA